MFSFQSYQYNWDAYESHTIGIKITYKSHTKHKQLGLNITRHVCNWYMICICTKTYISIYGHSKTLISINLHKLA